MNVLHPLSSVKALVIATTSCNRTHSGFFDLKHCYQRASADNIRRKFGPRSGPTKNLKLIKPDGFPDFFYHTFESTRKNKGADGTARALRVVHVFNKVGVLASCHTKGCDSLSCRKVDTTKPSQVKMGSRGFKHYIGVW